MIDSHVKVISESLCQNKQLQVLSLSKNKITDVGVSHLSYMVGINRSLRYLCVSWNKISVKGFVQLSKGLILNSKIGILDISFNPIGSNHSRVYTLDSMKKLALYFKKDVNLIHLDMSHCGFTHEDAIILNKGLKFNHTILGIHMAGNNTGIDPLGYLGAEPESISSS